YGAVMIGVPSQDPTLEMRAREIFHARISMTVCYSGLAFLAFSLLGITLFSAWTLARWLVHQGFLQNSEIDCSETPEV
ncbi:MAG TPA: hypothetical protein VFT74_13600, partial [Isosphaeraceae bacterium]|nr:hypothetical protein [Isosphaeraceae bacterium]